MNNHFNKDIYFFFFLKPITFSIIRNDFMLDQNKSNDSLTKLSQIEINTVSCSFGAGTSVVKNLHE